MWKSECDSKPSIEEKKVRNNEENRKIKKRQGERTKCGNQIKIYLNIKNAS